LSWQIELINAENETSAKDRQFNLWLSSSVSRVDNDKAALLKHQEHSPPSWIFDVPTFKEWLGNPDPASNALWMSGTTGFGKSVLAAYLTSALTKKFAGSVVTYFFCKEKDNFKETHQIVRTLVYQLCNFPERSHPACQAAFKCARDIWQFDRSIADLGADVATLFNNLLVPTLQAYSSFGETIFVMLDGLNELQEPCLGNALELIKNLQSLPQSPRTGRVRIIVTSQPTPIAIDKALREAARVLLTGANNIDNVEAFVKSRLNDALVRQFQKVSINPIQFFREHHHGMFLWVSTVLRDCEDIDHPDDLRKLLLNPPRSINDAYQRVLKRLYNNLHPCTERPWIEEIIRWSVFSKRDLTLSEIQTAILLSRNKYDPKSSTKLCDIEQTLRKCGSIIQIVESGTSAEHKTVSLLHETFKKFITSNERSGRPKYFRISASESECILATACISYLVTESVEFAYRANVLYASDRRQFFDYASYYWVNHLTSVGSPKASYQEPLIVALCGFFEKANLQQWILSVMTYTYNRIQNCQYDPLACSVSSSILNTLKWISGHSLVATRIRSVMGPGSDGEKGLVQYCAAIAAEAWLDANPKYGTASFRLFLTARDLHIGMVGGMEFRTLQILDDEVSALTELVQYTNSHNQYQWLTNQATAYLGDGRLQFLEAGKGKLLAAVDTGCDGVLPVATWLLSSCFMDLSSITESLDDANKAVEYAEAALDLVANDDPDYPDFLNMLARSLSWRSSRRKDQPDSEDSRRAMKVGKQAVRLALSIKTDGLFRSTDLKEGIEADWSPLIVLSTCRSEESAGSFNGAFNSELVWILETMSLALNGAAASLRDDFIQLVELCKTQLSQMNQQDSHLWHCLGLSLYRCHTASKADSELTFGDSARSIKPRTISEQYRSVLPQSLVDPGYILNEALWCYRQSLSLTPEGRPDRANLLNHIGDTLFSRNSPGDLDQAIDCYRKAVESSSNTSSILLECINNLGAALRKRNRSDDDLNEAMRHYRHAVKLQPDHEPNLSVSANQLGIMLYDRGTPADLAEAIECYMLAFNSASNLPRSATYANNLGLALCKRSSSEEDYTEAIRWHSKAIELLPEGDDRLPTYLGNLGHAYFGRKRCVEDLNGAIDAYRKRIELTRPKRETLSTHMDDLGNALLERKLDGDFDEAIDCFRSAMTNTEPDSSDIPTYAWNLARTFLFRKSSDDDLDEAIVQIQIAKQSSIDRLDRIFYADMLGRVFALRKAGGDLDKEVDCYRFAAELVDKGDSNYSSIMYSLALALRARMADGDANDSIGVLRTTLERIQAGDVDQCLYLHELGRALHERNGMGDLDEAINCHHQAIALITEKNKSRRATFYQKLSHALQDRCAAGDMTEAIQCARTALSAAQEENVDLVEHICDIGLCLLKPVVTPHGVDEAVDRLRFVVQATDDGNSRLGDRLHDLACALIYRCVVNEHSCQFEWMLGLNLTASQQNNVEGEARLLFPDVTDIARIADIDEATKHIRKAISLSQNDVSALNDMRPVLACCLTRRHVQTNSVFELTEAEELYKEVARSAKNDAAMYVGKLGLVCLRKYTHCRERESMINWLAHVATMTEEDMGDIELVSGVASCIAYNIYLESFAEGLQTAM
jgi:tetratricopeptide (TPR) repeat protein